MGREELHRVTVNFIVILDALIQTLARHHFLSLSRRPDIALHPFLKPLGLNLSMPGFHKGGSVSYHLPHHLLSLLHLTIFRWSWYPQGSLSLEISGSPCGFLIQQTAENMFPSPHVILLAIFIRLTLNNIEV